MILLERTQNKLDSLHTLFYIVSCPHIATFFTSASGQHIKSGKDSYLTAYNTKGTTVVLPEIAKDQLQLPERAASH